MAQVFLYITITCHIVRVARLSRQLDRGPLDGSVPSVFADLIKEQSKARLNALAVLSALPFFLSSILCSLDASNLRHVPFAGVARRGVRRYALRCESTTAGHLVWVLHALQALHGFQLAFSLCGLLGRQESSLATWSPLAITF